MIVDRICVSNVCRSAFLALVGGDETKRWIIATENMKPGDIIESTREIPVVASKCNVPDPCSCGSNSNFDLYHPNTSQTV